MKPNLFRLLLLIAITAAAAVSLALLAATPFAARQRSRCAVLCGSVVDARTGQPISRFTLALFSGDARHGRPIYALPEGFPQPPGPFISTTEFTSVDGWFGVNTGGAPNVHIAISAPGYRPHESGPVASDHDGVRVALQPARRIRVCIVDTRGVPVAGAKIFQSYASAPLFEVFDTIRDAQPLAITDANGELSVEEPLMRWTEMIVLKEPFLAHRVVIRREDETVAVRLRDGVPLDGRALSEDRSPVAAAALEARCEGYEPLITLARADGTFRFDALPATRCEVAMSQALVERDSRVSLDRVCASAMVDLAAGVRAVELVIAAAGETALR